LKLAESNGESFLKKLGAADIKAARALPAEQIQKATGGGMGGRTSFWPVADGNVLPGDPYELYEKGRFNDTPVLALILGCRPIEGFKQLSRFRPTTHAHATTVGCISRRVRADGHNQETMGCDFS
jgi:hypothetical protein